jgi:hypothetical protein
MRWFSRVPGALCILRRARAAGVTCRSLNAIVEVVEKPCLQCADRYRAERKAI